MRKSVRGYDNRLIKQINRCRILNVVRQRAPLSRAEIAELTGLDRKSITNFANELLDEGLIHEIGTRMNDRGPSSILLEIIPNRWSCIGIALHTGHATGLRIDLPDAIGPATHLSYPDSSANGVADTIKNLVDGLWPEAPNHMCGVGVSLPAFVQSEPSMVRRSVNMPQLNGLLLSEFLPSSPKGPFRFEGSAKTKALAEKWFGLGKDKSHFACVDLSDGVGAGIVHNRRLLLSPGDFTGEIGHLVVEPFGRPCACGNLGCLEAYVGAKTIHAKLSEAGCLDAEGKPIPHNAAAREIFRETGAWLGRGLAPLVNVVNPSSIIINGSLMAYTDTALQALWDTLRRFSLSDCWENLEIIFSTMSYSYAIGAACLMMSNIFEVPGHFFV